jgi:hypothetical protein
VADLRRVVDAAADQADGEPAYGDQSGDSATHAVHEQTSHDWTPCVCHTQLIRHYDDKSWDLSNGEWPPMTLGGDIGGIY